MSEEIIKKKFKVACHAVIVHDGKLLVVKLPHDESYYCLPGGHLEFGEDVKECLSREIVEEIGVKPVIGRLLYVQTYLEKEWLQTTEFIFEVTNGSDFVGCEKLNPSHTHEIVERYWASPTDDINILPKAVGAHFREGTILSDEIRYIKDF